MNDYENKLKDLANVLASNEKPPHSKVKTLMSDLSLNYSEDPIDQLNQVLLALHKLKKEKSPEPNKEKHH